MIWQLIVCNFWNWYLYCKYHDKNYHIRCNFRVVYILRITRQERFSHFNFCWWPIFEWLYSFRNFHRIFWFFANDWRVKPLFSRITWVYTFCHMAKDIREYFKQNTPRLPTDLSQSTIDVVQVELSKVCSNCIRMVMVSSFTFTIKGFNYGLSPDILVYTITLNTTS